MTCIKSISFHDSLNGYEYPERTLRLKLESALQKVLDEHATEGSVVIEHGGKETTYTIRVESIIDAILATHHP